MDAVQLTIIAVTFILTILIVFLGVQVWLILKEVRISLQKMNKMLDDFGKVTGAVGETASGMSGIVSGIKAGLSVFTALRKQKEGNDE
ncbi:hypothetical protein M1555_05440 [Patescibacteria group bacterium]|nr:hypothetical protein [Patescibacteria group bacterium]